MLQLQAPPFRAGVHDSPHHLSHRPRSASEVATAEAVCSRRSYIGMRRERQNRAPAALSDSRRSYIGMRPLIPKVHDDYPTSPLRPSSPIRRDRPRFGHPAPGLASHNMKFRPLLIDL